jgi:hypothetical protein
MEVLVRLAHRLVIQHDANTNNNTTNNNNNNNNTTNNNNNNNNNTTTNNNNKTIWDGARLYHFPASQTPPRTTAN